LVLEVNITKSFWELGNFAKDAPGIQNPWRFSKEKSAPFDREFFLVKKIFFFIFFFIFFYFFFIFFLFFFYFLTNFKIYF
jgi:hypothetical protein